MVAAVNPPDTVESVLSDSDYERHARAQLHGKLVDHCGLEVARGAPLDRPGLLGQQWDFRAAVRCAASRGDPRNVPGEFEAFMSEDGYLRPPNIPTRIVTPTKAGGAAEPTAAEYLAVFEITTSRRWARGERSLLPRLEKRLRLSVERARAHGVLTGQQTVTDLIAVVGVASPYGCSHSVCTQMDVEPTPYANLKAMMDAGRFVFVRVENPSTPASGGAGSTGRADVA